MNDPRQLLDHDDVREWLASQRLECSWPHIAPPRFRDATLDDLRPDLAGPLRSWCDDPARGNLILTGPVGPGKTHAAFAALRRLFVDLGVGVRWVPVLDLLDSLRPGGGGTVREYADYDVLVLDDLGLEKPSEWTVEQLDRLVNARWLHMRSTVVTTNLDADGLSAALGDRAYSRLRDGALALHVGGSDRRQPAA